MTDTFRPMPEEKPAPRGKRDVSLPIWDAKYSWWTTAVRRTMKERGLENKDLAAKFDFADSEVSRAISRKKPLFSVVMAISYELGIPYPVLLPESEEEASHLALQRRLFKSERQLIQIKSGVTENSKESQSPEVPSEDEGRKGQRRRKRPSGRVRVG